MGNFYLNCGNVEINYLMVEVGMFNVHDLIVNLCFHMRANFAMFGSSNLS